MMKMNFSSFSNKTLSEKDSSKEKILLVEDDQNQRICLKEFLEIRGYACLEADNGLTALNILATQPVDLIITDSHMPQMGGLEFIEQVNRHHSGELLPIFLVTGELSHTVRLQAFKNGVNRVFEKPLDYHELCHAVDWVTKFDLPHSSTA